MEVFVSYTLRQCCRINNHFPPYKKIFCRKSHGECGKLVFPNGCFLLSGSEVPTWCCIYTILEEVVIWPEHSPPFPSPGSLRTYLWRQDDYSWAPNVHSMQNSGCPSVPATFVAYGMRYGMSALLGKVPRNLVYGLSARPWHQPGKSNAERQPSHPAAQPADTTNACPAWAKWRRYPEIQSDPALLWLLWGLRRWCEESLWWKSRAEEAYIHRGILRRTACFHCSSGSWDHRLHLTKVAAGYILNANTMMTQKEKKTP